MSVVIPGFLPSATNLIMLIFANVFNAVKEPGMFMREEGNEKFSLLMLGLSHF